MNIASAHGARRVTPIRPNNVFWTEWLKSLSFSVLSNGRKGDAFIFETIGEYHAKEGKSIGAKLSAPHSAERS
jgi:hypothetical protein